MNQLKKLINRVIFLVVCAALVILLVFWMGKGPGNGPGSGPGNGSGSGQVLQSQISPGQKTDTPDVLPPAEPPPLEPIKIVKIFLGRKGVSKDRITWHDIHEFADFIRQLQKEEVKEVHFTLLPDSIERYEKKWSEELKKANMRSYISTDGIHGEW